MSLSTNAIKEAATQFPVMDLIRNRWSARSFSNRLLEKDVLHTILEAASWAPSANNEQPWLYFPAERGSERFEALWEALMPGNQPWAKNAACLLAGVVRTDFATSGKPNVYADHDLGLANAFLVLQARQLEVFTHIMAGFDKQKAAQVLGLADNQKPMVLIALGYLDDADKLEEPFKSRETTPRNRKALADLVL